MFDVARSINLPPHFVELRHEAAHEEMPSLGRLAKRTQEALRWLWEVYWVGLDLGQGVESVGGGGGGDGRGGLARLRAVGETEGGRKGTSIDESRVLLKGFRSSRVALLKSRAANEDQRRRNVEEVYSQCLRICGHEDDKLENLADVLVASRMVVPAEISDSE